MVVWKQLKAVGNFREELIVLWLKFCVFCVVGFLWFLEFECEMIRKVVIQGRFIDMGYFNGFRNYFQIQSADADVATTEQAVKKTKRGELLDLSVRMFTVIVYCLSSLLMLYFHDQVS